MMVHTILGNIYSIKLIYLTNSQLVVATLLTEYPVNLGTWVFFKPGNPVLLNPDPDPDFRLPSFTFTQKLKDKTE